MSGNYTVVVNDEGCTSLSDVYNFTFSGINESAVLVNVFPNPASSELNISGILRADVAIYNLTGELILSQKMMTRVDISTLPAGIYEVRISDDKGSLLSVRKITVVSR